MAGTLNWPRELLVVLGAATAYFVGRELVEGTEHEATANANRVISFERSLGIDIELDVQRFALDHPVVRELGNLSYVWLHWPLLIVIMATLYRLSPSQYRRLRSALCWSAAGGVLIFAVFPVAPPRFVQGFVGTVSDDARRHHLPFPMDWANRFASMPSFHAGWTLIACAAIAGVVGRRSLRIVVLVPAVLVAGSVVTTGNHYVIDVFVGVALAGGAYVVLPAFARRREPPVVVGVTDHGGASSASHDGDAHVPDGLETTTNSRNRHRAGHSERERRRPTPPSPARDGRRRDHRLWSNR